MKISVQTTEILDHFRPEEAFRLLHETGFDCVDFNMNMFLPGSQIVRRELSGPFTGSTADFLRQLEPYRKAAQESGITFGQAHAPYPSWTIDSEDMNALLRRSFEMCLEGCAYLECPFLVIHPVCMHYPHRLETDFENRMNIEMYSSLIPMIRKTGIKVCLENMFTEYNGRPVEASCSDFASVKDYLRTLNQAAGEEYFGFCYDCGHAALLGKDQRLAVHTLGKHIFALHLHDNDGAQDRHRFPGYGCVDWEALCRALGEIDYTGSINFETAGEMRVHGPEFAPELLRLLSRYGRVFSEKIEQYRKTAKE